jgi:hypothetical protein
LQPQPEDFVSSCFIITPVSLQAGHFLGLHLPSVVSPHLSHLKTAIPASCWIEKMCLIGNLYCFTQANY